MAPRHGSDDPVPALWRELAAVLPEAVEPASWSGPRWWWAGPLDVEGLALGSLQALATAVSSASSRRVTFTSPGVAAAFASFTHLKINGRTPDGFAPLSGFRRAADGWVRLHANYPHHEQALLRALEVEEADDVDAAVRSRPAAGVEQSVTAAGGLAVRVRTPGEWAASEPGLALTKEPWIRFDTAAAAMPGRRAPRQGGLLDGLRVLDLTRVIAGPSGSRILGALGADVLRVDPPRIPELQDQHVDTGFDKRSAVADLKQPGIRGDLRALLSQADVVLSAYRGGALTRFGLDAASLKADSPALAVVSLDAWGDAGPWAGRRGFDSLVQAATGISYLYGTGEGDSWRPGALPVQALDHATGLGMAAAAVALVAARAQGMSGSAHLSLARTAGELMRLPTPPAHARKQELDVPLRTSPSDYGDLVFVPPPLVVEGRQLEFGVPPQRYGTSPLAWLQPK
ncbi:CoA transferase [Pseudarthrobacter sp. J64]|uniref:CoA transferase n=1 Tax=Pseudarthrobacter sp. J64 TaxID=3116485 RepID=UPI002E812B78|nr:CoA transferase [Pseudarthrobacter sp. J64]MEE2570669.1 CoA transferase [Pseudarthrobacter sp. J64]